MNRDSTTPHLRGSQVQLVGVLFAGLVAFAWALAQESDENDTLTQDIILTLSPRVSNWCHFLSSVLLLATSLYAGCFDFTNKMKQYCHPNCNILFMGLAIPGLAASINLIRGTSDTFFNIPISVQLVLVAVMYCTVSSANVDNSINKSFLMNLFLRFTSLSFEILVLLFFSIIVSTLSFFPHIWNPILPNRFWESQAAGLNGVLALGNTLVALLGYQLLHHLPQKSGPIHVLCYILNTVGIIFPLSFFKPIFLSIPVLLQTAGIFLDIVGSYKTQRGEMQKLKEDCTHWQSVAEQFQALNNLQESAITAKSAFLTGLANEMKSIVHGSSMVMSMLNDTDIQPNQGTYLARLDRAVVRLTNLVKEAQYYFEVETQKFITDSVPFRLDQMLEEVINSTPIRSHLEERDVDVTYLVDAPVPMSLLGDYSRLKNILLRLLTNSIKATVQGEIVVWVRLQSSVTSPPLNLSPITPLSQSNSASSVASVVSPNNNILRHPFQLSSDPSAKNFSDLKISKLIPAELLASGLTSPPSTPTRESSRSLLGGSPRTVRSPRAPFNGANTTNNEAEGNSSPRGTRGAASLTRASSANSLRTTPKSGSVIRSIPDFFSNNDDNGTSLNGANLASSYTPPTSPLPPMPSPGLPTPLHSSSSFKDLTSASNDDIVHLSISVIDTGIGIPPEDLSRIFEPFAMVNRKREDTDLGLGLSICKQLARLFGGNLTVQSELSRGTSFTLTCPFKANSNIHLQNINSMFNPNMMLQKVWGVGKIICIIDNNSSIGAVCKMHLVPVGCEVIHYSSTTEAIAQMKVLLELGRVCDVVLIGYRLYGTNGEETARLLRSDPDFQNIPIVLMCTAKQRKQITLQNAHYLYKPLKKEQLMTIVHMLCTSVQPQQQPPSPEGFKDFSVLGEARSPRTSPLSASSPSLPRPSSNGKFVPLSLPPLREQDESPPPMKRAPHTERTAVERIEHRIIHSSSTSTSDLNSSVFNSNSTTGNNEASKLPHHNSVQDDLQRAQQLQQEQQQQQQQMMIQHATEKMQDAQLQHPLPPPVKVTDISTPPRDNSPRVSRLTITSPTSATSPTTPPSMSSPSITPSSHPPATPRTSTSSPDINPMKTSSSSIPPPTPTSTFIPPTTTTGRRGSILNEMLPPFSSENTSTSPIPTPITTPTSVPTTPTASLPDPSSNLNNSNNANNNNNTAPVVKKEKETILLVEDNPINAKIASAVLRKHQFEVELAGNGQVALEKVKLTHDKFQLILMDIHMPVMDGLTCARLVRQFEKERVLRAIPIIALTADATVMHRTACLEAGCNEFMSKPLDYPLLIEILKKLSAGGSLQPVTV